MQVRKRDGRLEDVNYDKILKSVERVCSGLDDVDFHSIAVKTIGGLYDGITTKELDELSIQTSVGFISEDPIYSQVASHLLTNYIGKEVTNQDIHSFSQSIKIGHEVGLINTETYELVMSNKRKLNNTVKHERNQLFDYYGLRIVYDRYLLRHPEDRLVIESPQYWLLRVACGLCNNVKEAVDFYNLLSSLEYMASTPTLFNSGTLHPQMSSCYLLDSPMDDLRDIEKRKQDVALLSKWAGGIGLSFSKVRSSGSLIRGTNGKSDGIVPFLHSLDANVAAVNQGGKRRGAACVYLDTHHPDLLEFLELRDNTGDPEKRTYNLNLANWIPDIFMRRVEADEDWSFFSPFDCPELSDLFGEEYEKKYLELEIEEKYVTQKPARQIYMRMMRTLAETGNGWMCFKDASNKRCNSAVNGAMCHSSNLCTEIIEPTSAGRYSEYQIEDIIGKDINVNVISVDTTSGKANTIQDGEISVCNLGSVVLSRYIKDGKIDKTKLRKNIDLAIKFLDRVIDKNFYPVPEAKSSNLHWRPIGLGVMGLQELFFKLRIPFDSDEAVDLSRELQEEIYFQALKTSCELAKEFGKHKDFEYTHAAKGKLQFDLAGLELNDKRWVKLKEQIEEYGLRNSLLIAIAPTVTIAAITGTTECIEPVTSNVFKTETLSGEFVRINKYMVQDLKSLGLWNENVRNIIKINEGSIQNIPEIPDDIKILYKTVWEIPMKRLIDHAISRSPFIDQSQSLNLFVKNPTIDKLSSMYMYCWKNGVKSTYYLRSRGATSITKVTVTEQVSVNLENPEICESCQ